MEASPSAAPSFCLPSAAVKAMHACAVEDVLHRERDGFGSIGAISRALVDVSDRGNSEKGGDSYVARNEKAAELWRPGAGFKPTSFIDMKGPKVLLHAAVTGNAARIHGSCRARALGGRLWCSIPPCSAFSLALLDQTPGCVQLAFVTTTSDSYRQIKLWTDYHKSIGVGTFYLFVDGQVLL